MEERELTLGEKRVRINFDTIGNSSIDTVKRRAAVDIDFLQSLKYTSGDCSGEQARLLSLAQTSYEEAAMWAVKAISI